MKNTPSDLEKNNIKKTIIAESGHLSDSEEALLSSISSPGDWGACASALIIKYALRNHANALNESAKKSEDNAKQLAKYTKWLVFATGALVFVGIAQVFVVLKN